MSSINTFCSEQIRLTPAKGDYNHMDTEEYTQYDFIVGHL
jgi:hypothetical protein